MKKSPEVSCPHCNLTDVIKRGRRKRKHSFIQLYYCKSCGKNFSFDNAKGKKFPLSVVIEAISLYNLGYSYHQTATYLNKKLGLAPNIRTISEWIEEHKSLCRYQRLRPYAIKLYSPKDMIDTVTLAHKQLYRYRYHRGKTRLMLEEFKNHSLSPIKDFLDQVSTDTPHQYFIEGARISEVKTKFDKSNMIVKSKRNYANALAEFVLPSVTSNYKRHDEIQKFFLANDSVTVATEVPVYLRKEDVMHFEKVLGFRVREVEGEKADLLCPIRIKGKDELIPFPQILTGHIDIVQIRNGQIHILDYKPKASKEKPIEQLTWYALALSRLTGMRLFKFTCAWFDENDYYEFYPLHVVKKIRKRKRDITLRDGREVRIPKENKLNIV